MNSPVLTAAIYARVSSETHAIDRQVETAKARMQTDGLTARDRIHVPRQRL
jgi:hypothetical protein